MSLHDRPTTLWAPMPLRDRPTTLWAHVKDAQADVSKSVDVLLSLFSSRRLCCEIKLRIQLYLAAVSSHFRACQSRREHPP